MEEGLAVLQASTRNVSGSIGLKQIRKVGLVPMAIVEKGKGTILIQAPERDLRIALSHATGVGQFMIQLDGEKAPRKVLIKQIDKDYLANKLRHVAVMQVLDTDVVTIELSVVALGTPVPVAQHEATMIHPTSHVKVKGQLQDIPDHFEIDISGLELHGSIAVSALVAPSGVEILTPADAVLIVVAPIVHEKEEEALPVEEAGAEPALVGESVEKSEGD